MAIIFRPPGQPTTPEAAVAAAFQAQAIVPEHVVVSVLDEEINTWTWRLDADAPAVIDTDVVTVDGLICDSIWRPVGPADRPQIHQGIITDSEQGWLVAVGDGESEDDLVLAVREHLDTLEADR